MRFTAEDCRRSFGGKVRSDEFNKDALMTCDIGKFFLSTSQCAIPLSNSQLIL